MELSKINQHGFYFRKSNCEWTVHHNQGTFPDNFSFNKFEMETLEVFGYIPSEIEGESIVATVTFTQEQIEAAKQTIYSEI